jgi:hypothetical protein
VRSSLLLGYELTEILKTFDGTATYDKPNRALKLAATLNAQSPDSGAGFEPATFGVMRAPGRRPVDAQVAHADAT